MTSKFALLPVFQVNKSRDHEIRYSGTIYKDNEQNLVTILILITTMSCFGYNDTINDDNEQI